MRTSSRSTTVDTSSGRLCCLSKALPCGGRGHACVSESHKNMNIYMYACMCMYVSLFVPPSRERARVALTTVKRKYVCIRGEPSA